MRIGRTLPPAAAPIYFRDIISGIKGMLNGKSEIYRFEKEIKEYFGMKYCFLVSSGKAGLTLILRALKKLHPGRDEVLIPAFNCYSVPSAIVRAGLRVRLCDVDPDTLDFNYTDLKKILEDDYQPIQNSKYKIKNYSKLLAIVPAHLFGLPSDIDRLKSILDDPDITVVEDAAQAMGVIWENRKLGTFGEVSIFSLGRGKAFSTVEGGIIIADNDQIGMELERQYNKLKDYTLSEKTKVFIYAIVLSIFMRPALFWIPKLFPFLKLGETIFEPEFPIKKLSPFQAGLTRNWRQKLNELIKARIKNTTHWINTFNLKFKIQNSKLPLFYALNSKLKTQNSKLALLRFPIIIKDKQILDAILYRSEQKGLGIMTTYPDVINNIKEIKDTLPAGICYPGAETLIRTVITVPVHPFVSLTDRAGIAECLNIK